MVSSQEIARRIFLLDLNLAARIARAAERSLASRCWRSVPAPANLARALLALGAQRVIAVERDGVIAALDDIARRCAQASSSVEMRSPSIRVRTSIRDPIRIVAKIYPSAQTFRIRAAGLSGSARSPMAALVRRRHSDVSARGHRRNASSPHPGSRRPRAASSCDGTVEPSPFNVQFVRLAYPRRKDDLLH